MNAHMTVTGVAMPTYIRKLAALLAASPPIVAGTAWTVLIAHDTWCPMSTDPSGCCRCDPDVSLVERPRPAGCHPWN
jgi:hypothetical protein